MKVRLKKIELGMDIGVDLDDAWVVAEKLRIKLSRSWGSDKGIDDEYYNLLML